MKKILFLSLLLSTTIGMIFAKPFKVVTTFTIIQDMTQNIAKEHAIVESITKPGADIHNYQPTPRDITKIQNADLILWNGLNLETWFTRFYNQTKAPTVVVTKGIQPIPIYAGSYKNNPNPHAWMSPKLALIYVDNIRDALINYDPEHRNDYQQNAENYKTKIKQLDLSYQEKFEKIPPVKRWLVTSEGAFSYLTQNYHFHEASLWPINADMQGTPLQVKHVIDLINLHHIPVIFSESTVSDKPAKQVAKETKIHYGGVLYVDSLSDQDGPTPTYLDLLNITLDTIAKGFGQ